jgi:hypothetical protein
MASGHVNRAKRPNTWAHRPMLHTGRKLLPTRSRPHMGVEQTSFRSVGMSASDPTVWTGRALQAECEKMEGVGLAHLYPALA